MRFTHKEVPRGFRVPFGPWFIPPLGALFYILLMVTSSKETGIRLAVWMGIGQVIYFTYGFWHSKLRFPKQIEPPVVLYNLATPTNNPSTENEYVSEMVVTKDDKL
jgi:APA family basic amino acid/polyamine antiporter